MKLNNWICNCDCNCDYENIRSVNPSYLIIHSATGYFEEKYNEKYLILDSTAKYKEVPSEIKFCEEDYARIGVNTDDNIHLNKPLKFPT